MFCTKCGNEIPDGAKFCTFCGFDLSNVKNEGPNPSQEEVQPPIKEKISKRTLILGAVAIVIVAVVVAIVAIVKEKNTNYEDEYYSGLYYEDEYYEDDNEYIDDGVYNENEVDAEADISSSNDQSGDFLANYGAETLQYPSSDDIFTYNVYETYAEVTGLVNDDLEGEMIIPESFDGLPVRVIGAYAFGGEGVAWTTPGCSITSLTIPDEVYIICEYAFYKCENLEYISFGENIRRIDSYAFGGCAISSVELPQNLTSDIGTGVFYECENLKSVTLGKEMTVISEAMFSGCTELNEIIWNSKVEYICDDAFMFCGFESMSFPDCVRELGVGVFSHCENLLEVTFHDNITQIGEFIFKECANLRSVTFGCGINKIPSCALVDCYSLEEIYFMQEYATIDEDALGVGNTWMDPIIYGYAGSTAADFAAKNGYNFSLM